MSTLSIDGAGDIKVNNAESESMWYCARLNIVVGCYIMILFSNLVKTLQIILLFGGLNLLILSVQAAGPTKVATMDRELWPESIESAQAFDRASQAEIMRFVSVMANTVLDSEEKVKAFTGLKTVNMDSVAQWQNKAQGRMVSGFEQASHTRRKWSWPALVKEAEIRLPEYAYKWYEASGAFYRYYLYEQVRLAALFPRISSEIDVYGDNELTGNGYSDGEFLLTYDDGPHPSRTQALITNLDSKGIKAQFFILGNKLDAQKHKGWYQTQCLGSHGWQHKSHTKLEWTKKSVTRSEAVIQAVQPVDQPIPFRPPYGARSKAVAGYLAQRDIPVYLWNIDSQDWNRKLSTEQVTDRVVTLMLLWRKGIILFHDIHPKANKALDMLDDLVQRSDKQWRSCR